LCNVAELLLTNRCLMTMASVSPWSTKEICSDAVAGIALPGTPDKCEAIYCFLHRLLPDDVEVITAFAFMQVLVAALTTIASFTLPSHSDGPRYADLGVAAVSTETRIGLRPSIGLGGARPTMPQQRIGF
jgi:hypothetical protein